MAARKAKPKTKLARKAAPARKPAPKAAKKAAAKKAPPKLPPKWSAAAKSEFDAIQARVATLSAGLKREDFDDAGNARPGPWASMLADLHAWAKKHKVKLESHEHVHEPDKGAPGGATPYGYGGSCPGSFTKIETKKHYDYTYVYTYKCTLRRQTVLGRCVYDCTGTYDLQP